MLTFFRSPKKQSPSDPAPPVRSLSSLLEDAYQYCAAEPDGGRRLFGIYPGAEKNPFQAILTQKALDHGYIPLPLPSLDAVLDIRARDKCLGAIPMDIHIHWVHRFLEKAHTAQEADTLVDQTLKDIEKLQETGCGIIWTVHNIISHERRFEAAEIRLRQGLSKRADIIHIMNPQTSALCRPHYTLDEAKTVLVAHPTYGDVYPNFRSRISARIGLGIRPHEKMVLFFGTLAPFKGIRRLIAAHQGLLAKSGECPIHLVIAGKSKDPGFLHDIQMAAAKPFIRLDHRFIGESDLQDYFLAADAVVCPYARSLNSGVAFAALTFQRPLVVPTALMPCFNGLDMVQGFDPDVDGSLQDAIQRALDGDGALEGLDHFLQSHSGAVLSDQFFTALHQRGPHG